MGGDAPVRMGVVLGEEGRVACWRPHPAGYELHRDGDEEGAEAARERRQRRRVVPCAVRGALRLALCAESATHRGTDEEDDLDENGRRGHDLSGHLARGAELGHEHERVCEVLLWERVDEGVEVVAEGGSVADRAENGATLDLALAGLLRCVICSIARYELVLRYGGKVEFTFRRRGIEHGSPCDRDNEEAKDRSEVRNVGVAGLT